MGGKRNENVSPRWSGDRRAFQRAKRFRENGGLVLDARAGIFIPNGKNDPSHRTTTLLALRGAGAGGAGAMVKRRGHF